MPTIRARHFVQRSQGVPQATSILSAALPMPKNSGGGLQQAGAMIAGFAQDYGDLQRRQEQEAQALYDANWTNSNLDDFNIGLAEELDRALKEDDPSSPGFAKRLQDYGRGAIEGYLDTAEDVTPQGRQAFQARAQALNTRLYIGALDTAREAGRAKAADSVTSAINMSGNRLFRDPGGLDQELTDFDQRLSSYGDQMDRDATRDFRQAGRSRMITAAVRGLAAKDQFDAAEALLASGKFDADLSPEGSVGLTGEVASQRAALERELKAQRAERREALGADARERAASEAARAAQSGSYNPATFDYVADVLGDAEATRLEENALRGAAVFKTGQKVSAMPAAEAEDYLLAIRPDPNSDHYQQGRDTFGADLADWEKVVANDQAFRRALAADPVAALDQSVAAEVQRWRDNDGAGATEDEVAAYTGRIRQREQTRRGIVEPRILSNAEAAQWTQRFDAGNPEQQLALLQEFNQVYGADRDRVAGELARTGLPPIAQVALTYATPSDSHVAADILAGAKHPERKEILPVNQNFQAALSDQLGLVFRASPSGLKGASQAAEALYVTYAARSGDITGRFEDSDQEDRLAAAIQAATGGVLDWNDQPLIAPFPGTTQDQFDTAIDNLEDRYLQGAVWGNGDAVTASDIDVDLTLATVGPGQYFLQGPDGAYIQDQTDGGPFVLDLGRLWPLLTVGAKAAAPGSM